MRVGTALTHLLQVGAEEEQVLLTHGLGDLDVGTVECTDGQRPVEGELHVARARRFHPCCRNLL